MSAYTRLQDNARPRARWVGGRSWRGGGLKLVLASHTRAPRERPSSVAPLAPRAMYSARGTAGAELHNSRTRHCPSAGRGRSERERRTRIAGASKPALREGSFGRGRCSRTRHCTPAMDARAQGCGQLAYSPVAGSLERAPRPEL